MGGLNSHPYRSITKPETPQTFDNSNPNPYNAHFTKILTARFSFLAGKISTTPLVSSKTFLSAEEYSNTLYRNKPIHLQYTTQLNSKPNIKLTTQLINPNQLTCHKLLGFFYLNNPSQLKYKYMVGSGNTNDITRSVDLQYYNFFSKSKKNLLKTTNILPSKNFNYVFFKKLYTSLNLKKMHLNINHTYHNTIIRFMENLSGNKTLLQFYPFVNQSITKYWLIKYKLWLPRLSFYEKKLGHKFFLEESLHILHLSLFFRDSKLLFSWLKAMILRISFWKTRLIFRFLKYLMLNFFHQIFPQIKIKGVKLKLKGKISSAGNSRKKLIIYRIGETSHSTLNLKVLSEVGTVITFTGVMGLQVSIFFLNLKTWDLLIYF